VSNIDYFVSDHYQRHNQRRLEHLASLGLPLRGRTVLELGAGIGDHTSFFLDRGCSVTAVEVRDDLADYFAVRFPFVDLVRWDLESPLTGYEGQFEIGYCYGVLYHVSSPGQLLESITRLCTSLVLIETCVSFGDLSSINAVKEIQADPTQAHSGLGCRPTRRWVFEKLSTLWPYVYVPLTQPAHEEFPIDWKMSGNPNSEFSRAVFIGSSSPISSPTLSSRLIDLQSR
jgi:SAM-dependent methyltransferase